MAEKIIKNPSLLPGDLEIELSGGSIVAISGHPLIGSGGGTQSDYVYYPVFDDTTGNVEFHLGTTASNPQPAGGWHISGATGPQGIQGIQGIPGVDGKNPVFEIDSNNAHWKWKYAEATSGWTDLGIAASGSVGPKGKDGADGVDGISPKVQINPQTNEWEVSEDGGTTWKSTGVEATGPAGQNGTNGTDGKDGKDGTNGKDGVSPTVSTSVIEGGNRVTFTYGAGSSTYIDVMSGAPGAKGEDGQKGTDGFSPTVTTSEISPTTQHPQGGTSVTITDSVGAHQFDIWNGLNGKGATVNLLEGTGIQITENGTDYTIGVSADYALKSELPDVTDMATKTWVGLQGYLTSVPDSYATKAYANEASANALSEAESWVGQRGFITKDVNNLTYYYKKTETSSTSEITNALSTKLDSTVAEQTYQTKAGMTNYLTTSDASTTYQPKGNYASASDITDMATKTWVGQQGYLTSIPNTYALKSDVEAASANAYNEAVAKIPDVTNFITKDVNDLTYYYKKTETSGSTELSTEFAKKVNNPDTSLADKYLVLRTDTNGAVSGWCNFNDKIYSKSESDGRYMQKNTDSTLSGDGTTNNPLGIDTTNMDDDKQYAFTTTGWEEVQGGGGGSYTAGDGIDITNDVISFDGLEVDTAYSGTLPKLAGDGTTEHPLSISAFSNSVETTLNSFSTALTNLANEISSIGSSITLKGEGTCNDITNYLNQAQVGDAYIATDNGSIWSKTVNKGDMVVKTTNSISVLTTSPDLSVYAKLSELPTVVPGANIVVTPTIVDGHTQYMITSVGGGGGAGMAYQFTSNDSRFTWSQSPDDPQSPTVMTETLNVNLPKFEAVTSMPGTTTPNTYYFVYEE